MLMRPVGAFSFVPSTSGMYDRISATHIRPSASKLIATGCWIIGSAATTSIRRPGGRFIVLIASSADKKGTGAGRVLGRVAGRDAGKVADPGGDESAAPDGDGI